MVSHARQVTDDEAKRRTSIYTTKIPENGEKQSKSGGEKAIKQ
jgi:hypothetical protein